MDVYLLMLLARNRPPTGHEDVELVKRAIQLDPHDPELCSGDKEAASAARKAMDPVSEFSVETHIGNGAFRDPDVTEHFLESARKAGLPICTTDEQLA